MSMGGVGGVCGEWRWWWYWERVVSGLALGGDGAVWLLVVKWCPQQVLSVRKTWTGPAQEVGVACLEVPCLALPRPFALPAACLLACPA